MLIRAIRNLFFTSGTNPLHQDQNISSVARDFNGANRIPAQDGPDPTSVYKKRESDAANVNKKLAFQERKSGLVSATSGIHTKLPNGPSSTIKKSSFIADLKGLKGRKRKQFIKSVLAPPWANDGLGANRSGRAGLPGGGDKDPKDVHREREKNAADMEKKQAYEENKDKDTKEKGKK